MVEKIESFQVPESGEVEQKENKAKRKRKPGSKYYEPKVEGEEAQDEYAQKVLGGRKAYIEERNRRAFEEFKKAGERMRQEKD